MFAYSFYCALCSITAHNILVLVTPLTVVKTCIKYVYYSILQIEKFGSNFTKHETERKYVKSTENCLKNDLTRLQNFILT